MECRIKLDLNAIFALVQTEQSMNAKSETRVCTK